MSTHVIKKTEYTSNVWFKVDNTIDESCFNHLFDMFEECTFTNVPNGTSVSSYIRKLIRLHLEETINCSNSGKKLSELKEESDSNSNLVFVNHNLFFTM
ncbi:MAG: hypothetical protein J6K75_01380 [Erysipelotrichaceae bacterium]|nr:hypothetical protein [Erysipelotrichaceae bacterium]